MKRSLPIVAASALVLAIGCSAPGQDINAHWNVESVTPRVSRWVLGYDNSKDGDYRDFQWERKQNINLTLARHFLNHNPDNPNHREIPSRFQPRPNHSILPNPVRYIHVEGLVMGLAIWGWTGSYIPVPIDSLLGTVEPGGYDEFWAGFGETGQPLLTVVSSFMHTFIKPALAGVVTRVHTVMPEEALFE